MKLISKIKYIIIFTVIIILLLNCNGQTDFYKKNYEFIELTKRQNKLIIYNPCDANVERITIRKDTLLITTHQDGIYTKVILKKERINENEFLILYNLTDDILDTVHLKKKKQLWEIDGGLYTENKFKQNYEYIEQPCIECFSKEDCDEFDKKHSVDNNKKEAFIYTKGYNKESAIFSIENKEWYGTYFFENTKANLDFRITIGDKLILDVEGRSHGYSDQLKVVKFGDTLGLYHYKNISGMNYYDARKYDLLKFYKSSDGKFYFEGKLPHFPSGAIEFKKVK